MNLYEKYILITEAENPDPETIMRGFSVSRPSWQPDFPSFDTGFYLDDIFPPPVKPISKPMKVWTQAEWDDWNDNRPPAPPQPPAPPPLTPAMKKIKSTIDILQNFQDSNPQGPDPEIDETINQLWLDYATEIFKEAGIDLKLQ